ncbi:MAG: hypothetical protein DRO95_00165 [Candidatus Altiarchaeales archaeon]|nr:MAG: hypothetical protein DRO67_02810 [Candidatus Asgardarchaeum californiense]RLI93303.1 MAG: hypothetical protein DRO95_00165 [Candidatus Altiarchaeales archaeon]HDO82521.1 class I SAM-dependent methyltransferase [Candidatus Altiarchaeales archaeon]HEX55170.1 class I SAM-dependent methyltransferase [Candidatus Altiarchaeales archaeon]
MNKIKLYWQEFFDEKSSEDEESIRTATPKNLYKNKINLFFECLKGKIREGMYVLDIGCGPASILKILSDKGCNCYGVDISIKQLKRARNTRNTIFLVGDAENLPFKDNIFDITICMDVIQYLESYNTLLDEMYRVTRDGGLIFVSTLNKMSIVSIMKRMLMRRDSVREYTPMRLLSDIRNKGFDVIEVRGVDNYLPTTFSHIYYPYRIISIVAVKSMKNNEI